MLTPDADSHDAVENADRIDILLVEDNPIDAEITLRTLKSHNSSTPVQWVKDGQEALDFLFGDGVYANRRTVAPPTLILLDIKMPKVSGIEVLRKIKADDRLREVPVVIISASSEYPDIAEAYRLGVNSYALKSINFDAFAETVAKVTNRYIPATARTPAPANQHSYRARDERFPLGYNAAI